MIYQNPNNINTNSSKYLEIDLINKDYQETEIIIDEGGGMSPNIREYKIQLFTSADREAIHGPRLKYLYNGFVVPIDQNYYCVNLSDTPKAVKAIYKPTPEINELIKFSYAVAEFMSYEIVQYWKDPSDINTFALRAKIKQFNMLNKAEFKEYRKKGDVNHIGKY